MEKQNNSYMPVSVSGYEGLASLINVGIKEAKKIVASGCMPFMKRGRGILVFFTSDVEKGYKKYLKQNFPQ